MRYDQFYNPTITIYDHKHEALFHETILPYDWINAILLGGCIALIIIGLFFTVLACCFKQKVHDDIEEKYEPEEEGDDNNLLDVEDTCNAVKEK